VGAGAESALLQPTSKHNRPRITAGQKETIEMHKTKPSGHYD
jgi:hypothetical protein